MKDMFAQQLHPLQGENCLNKFGSQSFNAKTFENSFITEMYKICIALGNCNGKLLATILVGCHWQLVSFPHDKLPVGPVGGEEFCARCSQQFT